MTKAYFDKEAEKFKKDVQKTVKEAVVKIIQDGFSGKKLETGKISSLVHIQKDDPELAK